MEKFTIEFYDSNGTKTEGLVMDKVLVLIIGTNASIHNYVVQEAQNHKGHIINPLSVIKVLN